MIDRRRASDQVPCPHCGLVFGHDMTFRAIPADTLDLVAMDAQVIRDCVRRSSSAPNVLQTIDYIAERMLAALDALRAARSEKSG